MKGERHEEGERGGVRRMSEDGGITAGEMEEEEEA